MQWMCTSAPFFLEENYTVGVYAEVIHAMFKIMFYCAAKEKYPLSHMGCDLSKFRCM
jgi:hypothetical protein